MSASEIKYVYNEWESKGQAVLLPYALQYNYEEIDGLLKDMDNIANEAGIGGIGCQSQESGITKLAEWAGYLNAYISSVIPELQESLDKPLYIAFNHHAAEDLSRIRMEDYTTENKLGIKRWVTVPGTEGMPTRELVEDTTLSMEDFLGLTVLEEAGERKIIGMPKEFQDFTYMFAVDYNLIKDELEKQNGKEVTLEDYLLSIKSAGEFSHKMDKPVEEFISAVLDITAVKPLIECCTGYDMITGEDLSDFERGMKGVSAVVSLFTLGQGSIVMNGGKLALGETVKMEAKILVADAISTGVAYGTSEICQAMGCPGGLTLVLSLLAGMGTSAGLGSKVFGNGGLTPDDIAYQRYWDDVAGGVEYKYNMVENPGSLVDVDANAAGTFRSGKYNVNVLDENTVYYRAGDSTKSPLGQYYTAEPPSSVADVRINSAVKPQWIDPKTGALTGTSNIDTIYAIEIPKGTATYSGPAGYQGGIYIGGKEQIFVPKPWNIDGVKVISSIPLK